MRIVLYQPQIPQNTGNIVRTASVTGFQLSLVPPFGFSLSSRHLKRAGLDYWEGVDVEILEDLQAALEKKAQSEPIGTPPSFYFFSSKGTQIYSNASYQKETWLIFGSETSGLPEELTAKWPDRVLTLPQLPAARCLNLATATGIAVYEAWKQTGFSLP